MADLIDRDVKDSLVDGKSNHARVNVDIALSCIISLLLCMLSKICIKLDHTLSAAFIGSSVTNAISGRFTTLTWLLVLA